MNVYMKCIYEMYILDTFIIELLIFLKLFVFMFNLRYFVVFFFKGLVCLDIVFRLWVYRMYFGNVMFFDNLEMNCFSL